MPTTITLGAEIYWRARGGVVQGGKLQGIWIEDERGRQAVFDTGGSLEWLLGPRVDNLLLMGELAESGGAEVWDRPNPLPGSLEPLADDDDWHLGEPETFAVSDSLVEEVWVLTLLDLLTYEYLEIPCELNDDGALIAPDAEELSQSIRQAPGSLSWAIERRIEGLVIERRAGRL